MSKTFDIPLEERMSDTTETNNTAAAVNNVNKLSACRTDGSDDDYTVSPL